ncbi:hypothetical protein [Streptomyces erythrochromogenes]|uniref:hypothetical protein n=1 Tax=Streptomyces erythrochromogenes TaxID=285574 RepID=UPI0036755B55
MAPLAAEHSRKVRASRRGQHGGRAAGGETLPQFQHGEPWYEIGVDDPQERRARHPEAVGR